MWNCFFKPFTKSGHVEGGEQKDRLDAFYSGQADVYDSTRTHLLKGRETMLQLLAAHLKAQPVPARAQGMAKPKIWVDIGGGTGWNIEKMYVLEGWRREGSKPSADDQGRLSTHQLL
jgi:betaine lipid synthase